MGSTFAPPHNPGQGPRVFVVHGHVYHTMPRLAKEFEKPTSAQAYFLDSDEASEVRRGFLADVKREQFAVVEQILIKINPYAKFYETVRETMAQSTEEDMGQMFLRLNTSTEKDPDATISRRCQKSPSCFKEMFLISTRTSSFGHAGWGIAESSG